MDRSRLIGIICILWLCSFTGVYSVDALAGPEPAGQDSLLSEKPDGLTWDFGKVKEGEVLKYDFTIKNESARDMKITEITTSCGCTLSRFKKPMIKPQESTQIEVKFNTKGYSGKVKQFVYVHTDSLDKPLIRYIITADIVSSHSNPKF